MPARADGDAAAGRKLYQNKCLSCHGDAKTKGTLGPSLVGIIGRHASDPGEGTTSRAMSEADFVWTETVLDEYLAAPSNKVHGTIMPDRDIQCAGPRRSDRVHQDDALSRGPRARPRIRRASTSACRGHPARP